MRGLREGSASEREALISLQMAECHVCIITALGSWCFMKFFVPLNRSKLSGLGPGVCTSRIVPGSHSPKHFSVRLFAIAINLPSKFQFIFATVGLFFYLEASVPLTYPPAPVWSPCADTETSPAVTNC